ncbi:hypothetical protein IWW45_005634, partial [Coemansia sp. RSA 485]
YGSLQGNTLNMTVAEMSKMPPMSPFLTNVHKQNQPDNTGLVRSNSAAAQTAAAVKRLQAIPKSSPKQQQQQQPIAEDPLSASSDLTMASPVHVSAVSEISSVLSPQRTAVASKYPQDASMSALRNLILSNHPSARPPPAHERTQSAGPRAKPMSTGISVNLGNMSLDAKQRELQARIHQQQQQPQQQQFVRANTPSSPNSVSDASTPERLVSAADQNRSRSVTGGSDGELTKSEDEVRNRFENVRIALSRANSTKGSMSENSDSADRLENISEQPAATLDSDKQAQAFADDPVVDEDPQIEIDEDIQALYRDIDEVSRMLPPSQGSSQHEDEHSECDNVETDCSATSRKQQKRQSPEQDAKAENMFVDVVIDQQPMDVGLENLSVDIEHTESREVKKKAGSPGKRKLSDSGKSVSEVSLSSASSRMVPPRAALPIVASRGRGRGRGKIRPGLHTSTSVGVGKMSSISRKQGLIKQPSSSSLASSSRRRDDSATSTDIPPRTDSRIGHHAAGGANKARAVAATGPSSTATGSNRVAEFRRKFESADGHSAPAEPSAFAKPVVAMRSGYPGTSNVPASSTPNSIKRGPASVAAGNRTHAARAAPIRTIGAGQKSSTAAMREAARINAAASSGRKPAAGLGKVQLGSQQKQQQQHQQQQQSQQRSGNEHLFKSVARPESATLSRQSSASSLRSQSSDRRPRPAPLPISNNNNKSGSSGRESNGGNSNSTSSIPIPIAKGKSVSRKPEEASKNESTESAGWGLSSVISMLSPSSWKSQTNLAQKNPDSGVLETPTSNLAKQKTNNASPYDVDSPQTPYRPRPEHGGGRAELVMPKYTDIAVPLRRNSDRSSISSVNSVHSNRANAKRPSQLGTSGQRLISMTAEGRLSGVSSFRSSFFSDDEGASTSRVSQAVKRGPSMLRTKSTPDLAQAQQLEQQQHNAAALMTPVPRHKRSNEYTSIIPDGSNSPPEVESDYSDEYSDEEFSPAVKRKKNDFRIPSWATTPELAKGLRQQERINPDRIFGRVKPLRVSEIFNRKEAGDMRRKPRNSSMIWTGTDALTADDELEYIRRMGFEN